MVTFLLLFTSRKSFQSASFSLSREQGSRRVRRARLPPWLPRGHTATYCMSVWTWSGRWGPPWPGATVRKLNR